MESQHLGESVAQMRALIQSCRERVMRLRPAWEAHLVEETLQRLDQGLNELVTRAEMVDCAKSRPSSLRGASPAPNDSETRTPHEAALSGSVPATRGSR